MRLNKELLAAGWTKKPPDLPPGFRSGRVESGRQIRAAPEHRSTGARWVFRGCNKKVAGPCPPPTPGKSCVGRQGKPWSLPVAGASRQTLRSVPTPTPTPQPAAPRHPRGWGGGGCFPMEGAWQSEGRPSWITVTLGAMHNGPVENAEKWYSEGAEVQIQSTVDTSILMSCSPDPKQRICTNTH